MNFKKKFLGLFLIIFFFNFTIASTSEPKEFIQTIINEVSTALSDQGSKEEKIKKLTSIAKNSVDIKGIGFYTLGSHKKNITDQQIQKYIILFEKYFLKTFSNRLADYADPKINVVSEEVKNEKYTIVSSVLLATDKRPEVKIDWRVYTKNLDKLLIRDLIIEGLSLARTQKEEFNSIIQSNDGDITKLFIILEEFVNKD